MKPLCKAETKWTGWLPEEDSAHSASSRKSKHLSHAKVAARRAKRRFLKKAAEG